MSIKQPFVLITLILLLTAACTSTPSPTPITEPTLEPPTAAAETPNNLTLPDGYRDEILVSGLNRPTQMIIGPDGQLWLGQLNGGESAEQGQIITVDLDSGTQTVLLEGLNKPTGLAVLDGYLWVAIENTLLRAPLDGNNSAGEIEVILEDMPYNGRSNGTLTISPDNRLIYETSGRRSGNRPSEGSGILWELDPVTLEPRPLATGLKGAYAHTFDADGRLWATEIGDGTFNDGPPPGELNLIVEGADFGWPQCIGFQEPALNFEGTEEICAQTRPPVVNFPPHSTPTSVIASPFAANSYLVALWVTGEVWQVSVAFTADNAQGETTPFITEMGNPQHLLLLDDGSILVSDYSNGTVYRVYRP